MRDVTYPPIIVTAKAAFKALGQRIQMTGTEHVPREGGVLLAYNHIGYVEIFDHRVAGPLMRSLHHIEVDRGEGVASFHTAVDYLRRGEAVGIFPEATISRAMELKEFKSGAVRIAAEAGVPIVPVILWGTQRMMTKDHPRDFSRGRTITIRVGEPLHVTGENAMAETATLKARMSQMLTESITEYPEAAQPPGSWWVPASLGGTAPTLEEAAALDAAEKRERARKRAEKRAKRQGGK
jgi:1-acyl-sn-glycerol-3-phosphate acyltransferase